MPYGLIRPESFGRLTPGEFGGAGNVVVVVQHGAPNRAALRTLAAPWPLERLGCGLPGG